MKSDLISISKTFQPIEEGTECPQIYIQTKSTGMTIINRLQIDEDISIDNLNALGKQIFERKRFPNMIALRELNTIEINSIEYVDFVFESGYTIVLKEYHQNHLQFEELLSQLKDIIQCYLICVEMNLPIHISMEDMSLMTKRNNESPFPQICISPYAFIVGYLN